MYSERRGNYTIPRKIRELQFVRESRSHFSIIPYQEKLGNYNSLTVNTRNVFIIPYQEKLGNYNYSAPSISTEVLYHTKKN